MQYTIDNLISDVSAYLPEFDKQQEKKLRYAYEFAKDAHENFAANKEGEPTGKPQIRFSGEPYIIHPLETAHILTQLKVDLNSIIACLLHDVIEDTTKTEEDIKVAFGSQVRSLAVGMVKLSSIRYREGGKEKTPQVENLKKMFLAMAKDMRVVFIKLADRLHNMRTIKYVQPEKQNRIARETLEIYAPLAERLGIFLLKPELEDLCFEVLHPEEFQRLTKEIGEHREKDRDYIKMVCDKLKQIMKEEGITGDISYRLKHYYSVYKKMKIKDKTLDEIFDKMGIKIIVQDIPTCYRLLGIVHHHFNPMLRQIRDYIATPKVNGYQSLHTTVFPFKGKLRKPTEIQIRTVEMEQTAAIGAAAHFKYSEKKQPVVNKEDEKHWIQNLAESQKDFSDHNEFLQSLKLDFFSDRIFVYTPYGDIKDLPAGSTPIDFAYTVHTDLGDHCKMAKVNNKAVSLHHKLKNGDTVDIMTKLETTPRYEWLSFVKTSAARSKIRQYLRTQDYEKNRARGSEILNHELKKLGKKEISVVDTKRKEKVLAELPYKTFDDLLISIGEGTQKPITIIHKMYSEQAILNPQIKSGVKDKSKEKNQEILVGGIRGLKIKLCNHCNPEPGNEIIGFITHSQGIKIHLKNCKYIRKIDKDRLIPSHFKGDEPEKFAINAVAHCKNRVGLLRDIASLFASMKINILDVDVKRSEHNPIQVKIHIKFETSSLDELNNVLTRLSDIPSVDKVKKY